MSELGKPPKIARPTAKTVAGLSRPAGSAQAKPAVRQPAGQGGAARPAAGEGRAARPAAGARPAVVSGPAPARAARPKPRSSDGPADSAPQTKNLAGLGNFLKTKREIHGLTRRDVVVKIKIPLEQLEAIEDGRLSSLPPVFAKGFLRAYANELGLDAETILDDYRQMTGGFKNEPASRQPLSSRYVESSVGTGRIGSLKGLYITLGALAALAALLFFWPGLRYTLGSVIPFLDQAPGFTAAASSSTTPLTQGDSPGGATVAPTASDQPREDNIFVEDSIPRSGPDSLIGSISPPPSPAVLPEGGTLSLSSREDKVWVQVVVDGEYREHLILNAGQKAVWTPKRQIIVTTGQANALSATWNDQDLGLLSNKSVDEVTFPKS